MSSKTYLKSKTIWGALMAMLPVFGPLLGLGVDDQTLITATGDQLVTVAGGLLAIYGRTKATMGVSLAGKR